MRVTAVDADDPTVADHASVMYQVLKGEEYFAIDNSGLYNQPSRAGRSLEGKGVGTPGGVQSDRCHPPLNHTVLWRWSVPHTQTRWLLRAEDSRQMPKMSQDVQGTKSGSKQ